MTKKIKVNQPTVVETKQMLVCPDCKKPAEATIVEAKSNKYNAKRETCKVTFECGCGYSERSSRSTIIVRSKS